MNPHLAIKVNDFSYKYLDQGPLFIGEVQQELEDLLFPAGFSHYSNNCQSFCRTQGLYVRRSSTIDLLAIKDLFRDHFSSTSAAHSLSLVKIG